MIKIEAHIPARTVKSSSGKVFSYPAHTNVFTQDERGVWSGEHGKMLEAEVIDVCRKATNWREIRIKHFPMFGFHN